jgi:Ca2+-transporting ATPase
MYFFNSPVKPAVMTGLVLRSSKKIYLVLSLHHSFNPHIYSMNLYNGHPGLTEQEAAVRLKEEGPNVLFEPGKRSLFALALSILAEPMVLLLIVAALLYFILGESGEGYMLLAAIMVVASISFFQTVKSDNALRELGKLTQPRVDVLRDGVLKPLPATEIVRGDLVLVEEGMNFPCDGRIIRAFDLGINEAALTGESVAVSKQSGDPVFAGTLISSGSVYLEATATGIRTELGKLGKSMEDLGKEKTVLQIQIDRFVRSMAWAGLAAFITILGVHFFETGNFIHSLLRGLTVAMALIPEEIPVAFASFMALGALRLSGFHVLAREPRTVESLGSATVICADKTGTLTTEGMELACMVSLVSEFHTASDSIPGQDSLAILRAARISSEPKPFDAMEKAIAVVYEKYYGTFSDPLVMEYPLDGVPPMMTHVVENKSGIREVAAKGGLEKILEVCRLPQAELEDIRKKSLEFTSRGFRVLGVASAGFGTGDFPARQEDFDWKFLGFICLFNPPKPNASEVVRGFYEAGIQVKMITGDFPSTASAIAGMVGIRDSEKVLTGDEVMRMRPEELASRTREVQVFARMFPDAKLRVVQALKTQGEVVAMTGDGVNDGPALKAAHIGVSMGKRGTEMARQAASLVLVNDDLRGMLDAVALGRKIYQNLKKAVSYIVSIHVPIILTVTLPLLFGWSFTELFTPIHVIFLELVMGPTCSIAFENEPAEAGQMQTKPRKPRDTFFSGKELGRSILQGLAISALILFLYRSDMQAGLAPEAIRTRAFSVLVFSNVLLTLANRSFLLSFFRTLFIPNRILWLMLGITIALLFLSVYQPAIRDLFGFVRMEWQELLFCFMVALPAVLWVEGLKWYRRRSLA